LGLPQREAGARSDMAAALGALNTNLRTPASRTAQQPGEGLQEGGDPGRFSASLEGDRRMIACVGAAPYGFDWALRISRCEANPRRPKAFAHGGTVSASTARDCSPLEQRQRDDGGAPPARRMRRTPPGRSPGSSGLHGRNGGGNRVPTPRSSGTGAQGSGVLVPYGLPYGGRQFAYGPARVAPASANRGREETVLPTGKQLGARVAGAQQFGHPARRHARGVRAAPARTR